MTGKKKKPRYSISVTGKTYDRLRLAVGGSLQKFVDEIVRNALDDPTILARVTGKCRPKEPLP